MPNFIGWKTSHIGVIHLLITVGFLLHQWLKQSLIDRLMVTFFFGYLLTFFADICGLFLCQETFTNRLLAQRNVMSDGGCCDEQNALCGALGFGLA